MTVSVRIEGLDELKRKLLSRFPAEAVRAVKDANEKNATEFKARVSAILPTGDPERGHLVESLKVESVGPVGFSTSIGDAAHPYPAHLEFGHMAGSAHVPGKPAWFPALRLFKKRAKARAARALKKAVDAVTV